MKRKMRALTVLLTLVLCLAVSGAALAISSANYALPWTALSAGGGDRSSSNYVLGDTAGQSSAIGLSQSTNYRLGSGYWYRDSEMLPAYQITGTTGEVNCDILPEVTVELYQGAVLKGSTISDGSGNYSLPVPEPGDYDVKASKAGLKDEAQSISITGEGTYTLDFQGGHGLVPNAPNMSYVLGCINHWLYPQPPCGLSMSKVLAVINAWLYPQ